MMTEAPAGRRAAPPWVRAEFERHDPRFRGCDGDEWLQPLFVEGRWTEGPAYFPAGRYLVFSDIPNDRLLRWDETTGAVGVFRSPAQFANGNLCDHLGRLVTCEQAGRRLTRTEPDGGITVVAERWRGHRFNSPDVVIEDSSGALWFSDPSYGIDSAYEGIRGERDLDRCLVFRIAPGSEEPEVVVDDCTMPNGLAFTPDQQQLYVVDSGEDHIRRFDVRDGRRLSGGVLFAHREVGGFDSLCVDSGGRVWAASGSDVLCYHSDGTLLATLPLGEPTSNLTFGGPRGNDLFITATSSVHVIRLKVTGARR